MPSAAKSTSRPSIPSSNRAPSTSTRSIALADVAPFVGPAFYEDAEQAQLPLHQQRQPGERAGKHQPVGQGRLGRRHRHADQLHRLQRPDQLLPDGRHQRRVPALRARRHLPVDQRRQPDRSGLRAAVLRHPVQHLVHAGRRRRCRLPAAVRPVDLRRLPVPAARPGRPEPRSAPHLPGDQPLRWVAGAYFADIDRHVVVSQGSDLGSGFQARPFVPTSGPNPTDLLYDDDFSSKVYAVFGQIAYDVMDNLELALALRFDSEDREVSNNVPGLHRRPTPRRAARRRRASLLQQPVHQPGLHGEPGLRHVRHPEPQQDLRAAAAEALGQLEAHRRLRGVRVLRLRLPQRRLQFLGQRRDRRDVLRLPVPAVPRRQHQRHVPAGVHRLVAPQPHRRQRHVRERSVEGRRTRLQVLLPRSHGQRERRAVPHDRSRTCSSSTSSPARSACCAS